MGWRNGKGRRCHPQFGHCRRARRPRVTGALRTKRRSPVCGNFPWVPSHTAYSVPAGDMRIGSDTAVPRADLACCPWWGVGDHGAHTRPGQPGRTGTGQPVPRVADDPAARVWRKQAGTVQEFRVRASTFGTENPRGGPSAHEDAQSPRAAPPPQEPSQEPAQLCQSCKQAGHSPSVWARWPS